ncbi:MAG: hypothetical protein ACYC6Y_18450 [Thermoguttaceae bacterium]
MNGGEIGNWKRLDQVLALVGDKRAFADFVRTAIEQMLTENRPAADSTESAEAAAQMTSPTDTPQDPGELPIPMPSLPLPPPQGNAPAELPLPQ